MSLADYLAKKYLTADPKPEKKSKKRKRKDASVGLVIADDDALGWNPNNPFNADEDTPLTGQHTRPSNLSKYLANNPNSGRPQLRVP